VSFYSTPVDLLKEAQKETFELRCLVINLFFLIRETTIFQNIESKLSDLESGLGTMSKKFQTLSFSETQEKGYSLIWEICKIKTLIQERLRNVSEGREKFNLEDFSDRLIKIEVAYIHPAISRKIGL
jgi:hypothetical protein